jgi:hypothetical protein
MILSAHHAEVRWRTRATLKQARDRREHAPGEAPVALVGSGIYVGLAASVAIVAFGLTIVVKRASQAYVVTSPDDDV